MEHDDRGAVLLAIARRSLDEALCPDREPRVEADPEPPPWLSAPGATFVTLRRPDGSLRGCLGSLEARRPLIDDLRANTVAAASRDPRFAPVTRDELDGLRIEVSWLGEPEALSFEDEASARRALRPAVDGIVLTYRGHRATFLPQVWEVLPEARDFLAQLKHKAGLAPDFWHPEIRLARYTVDKWSE